MTRLGTSRSAPRAVVAGAGLMGLLAAAVLAEAGEVTVVERDRLPDGPAGRRGLPQARHAHLLWSGGARAVESLLPGTGERWLAAGARRIPLPSGLVAMTAHGWLPRLPEMQYLITCSRDLLDWVVREQVTRHPAVRVLDGAELLGLRGGRGRVTGVAVRTAAGVERLDADVVVDATGRGSRAREWLRGLGLPPAPEETVDPGLVYASRIFRAPPGSDDFPLVSVQSDPSRPVPARTAVLVPIEHGRWLVTLSGTRGGRPGGRPEDFERFARTTRHPVVGELISRAEPLTGVTVSRSTVNRRRSFEKTPHWPEGFVVLGDAAATFNPVYGHGMSVAALSALALRAELASGGLRAPGLARRVQRAAAAPVALAWDLATGVDLRYPGVIGAPPGRAARALYRYFDRLMLTATGRAHVARALIDVMTLSAPPASLLHPDIAVAVLRGPGRPSLPGPPLTRAEHDRLAPAPRTATE